MMPKSQMGEKKQKNMPRGTISTNPYTPSVFILLSSLIF
jgi:hypothetical protein